MFVQEIEPLAVYVNIRSTYVLQQQQVVDSTHITGKEVDEIKCVTYGGGLNY